MMSPVLFVPRTLWIASALLCGSAGFAADAYLKKPDDWFASAEGKRVTACVLSWQSEDGDWPKNQDTTRREFTGKRSEIEGTFDNKATTDELRLLARAYRATGDTQCLKAVEKGVDLILKAQYPNGGWPQYYPLRKGYYQHITFNDGSMVRLLEFVREVAESENFAFLDTRRRAAAGKAFERGVECVLKCQIEVDGRPTVWCAQHDAKSLKPVMARSYELESFSGGESAGILRFLMSLEDPSPEVIRAVKAGVEWYETAKIEGIRIERSGGDRVVVKDESAKPVWARFYDLKTGRPFFCDRDGVKKDELSQIGKERRTGYAWYGNWGESVARDFAKWPQREK